MFRITTLRYANGQDLLSGVGSRIHGGRWNPPGAFDAVYGSLEVDTMMAEVLGRSYRAGFAVRDLTPRVLVAIEVRLRRVLRLTDGAVRNRLRVSQDRMTREPWLDLQRSGRESLTQAIGRLAWESGLEGLLAPSAACRRGTNLIAFPGNLSNDSGLWVVNPESLPDRPPIALC